MHCPHCGRELPDGSLFCEPCGKTTFRIVDPPDDEDFFDEPTQELAPSTAPTPQPEPEPQPEPSIAPMPRPEPAAPPARDVTPPPRAVPTGIVAAAVAVALGLVLLAVLMRPAVTVQQIVPPGPVAEVISAPEPAPVLIPEPAPEPVPEPVSAPEPAPAPTPFTIDFMLYKDDDAGGTRLTDGSALKTGDHFWISFRSSETCYVYVLNEGPTGRVTPLYPRPDFDTGYRVEPGVWVRLPGAGNNYVADDETGEEVITLVASLGPVEEIDRLIERFLAGRGTPSDRERLQAEIRTRDIGIAPRVEKPARGLEMEKIEGRGSLVRKVVLQHE